MQMMHGGRSRYQAAYTGQKTDLKANWGKILLFAKTYWGWMISAVIAAAVGTILTLLGPDKLSEMVNVITDGFMKGVDMEKIKSIGLTLICFYAVSFLLSVYQQYVMASVNQGVSRSMRTKLSDKISKLPMSYFNKVSTGDVLSRVTNDVDTISQSFNQSIGNLVSAAALFAGSLVMMLKTSVLMTLAAVMSTILGFVLMMLIMSRSQKYFTRQQKSIGDINGHVEEIYTMHTTVKAYNGEQKVTAAFDELNGQLKDSAFRAQSMSGLMMPMMQFIGNFGYVAVCVAGAVLVMNDKISVGVIVAFMMYVRYFTQPLAQIAQAAQSLQAAAAAGERIFDFLDAEELEDESTKKQHEQPQVGTVTFDHVSFGYDPEKIIIHDFSAEAKKGQKIAIVGPTGAGKTTLINLLMRFYELNGGKIEINGVDSSKMTREQVHDQFCMVLQETWLFEGTIRENLTFGMEGISDEKMRKAAAAVGIAHFIETLPDQYETFLWDELNLSQGQRQQLTIARAMLEDKPMLILDEATSSVDTRTELQIQKAMDQLMADRTSFVIAHRLSTIKNADLILVLKDGDVIESGNHEELLAKKGFYHDLYMSQFEKTA